MPWTIGLKTCIPFPIISGPGSGSCFRPWWPPSVAISPIPSLMVLILVDMLFLLGRRLLFWGLFTSIDAINISDLLSLFDCMLSKVLTLFVVFCRLFMFSGIASSSLITLISTAL